MDSLSKYAHKSDEKFVVSVFTPDPRLIKKRRKTREVFNDSERRQMFRFWCGNESEGLCPNCNERTIQRTNRHTYEIAHICAWSKGGAPDLYNVFPACHACNRETEQGGLRYGDRGVHHFDGIIMAAFYDQKVYSRRLVQFMDKCYDWLYASGARKVDKNTENENKLSTLRAFYGPTADGGWTCTEIEQVYKDWLFAKRKHLRLQTSIDAAKIQIEEARKALENALMDEKLFQEKHARFF